MRNTEITINGYTSTVEFPDTVAFVFNPLFCNISTDTSITSLTLKLSHGDDSRSVTVYLYQGTAKIYFSRILQLFFDDYIHIRSMLFSVALLYNDEQVFVSSLWGIWGGLNLGERYGAYGEFNYEGKAWHEKTRVWFKNFPFTVSLFLVDIKDIYGSADGGSESVLTELTEATFTATAGQYSREGIFEVIPSVDFPSAVSKAYYRIGELSSVDVFDETYDETFRYSALSSLKTNLIVCGETNGHYLRWIDNVGEIQYFLFAKGKTTIKTTLQDGEVSYDSVSYGDINYANIVRTMGVNATRTVKCCAVNLKDEIFAYVSTILTSPYVDLYLGKNPSGEEIWIPVNMIAQSVDYTSNDNLHDMAFSFTLSDFNAQTL